MTTPKVISPAQLAHIVSRTPRFAAPVERWKTVLGAEARHENDRSATGLDHVAFTYAAS